MLATCCTTNQQHLQVYLLCNFLTTEQFNCDAKKPNNGSFDEECVFIGIHNQIVEMILDHLPVGNYSISTTKSHNNIYYYLHFHYILLLIH